MHIYGIAHPGYCIEKSPDQKPHFIAFVNEFIKYKTKWKKNNPIDERCRYPLYNGPVSSFGFNGQARFLLI
jgi:hypothetical protein